MALIVTHELGHVLGLDHEDRICATMNSYLVNNGPEHCPAAPEGMWVCRLLRTDDVRGAVSLYGGNLPHNNLMPYLTMNFNIALQGVFPARP